jgi:hypothetical protein
MHKPISAADNAFSAIPQSNKLDIVENEICLDKLINK